MPVLESLSNQQEEESARKFIERITGFSVIKLHRFSKIDWLICGNSLNQTTLYREPFGVAYGEFKGRKQHESFFKQNGFLISMDKWEALHLASSSSHLPFFLFVKTNGQDGPLFASMFNRESVPDKVVYGGRRDRGLETDLQPQAVLNWDRFTQFDSDGYQEILSHQNR